jgi:Flp pilus assembly protein TadG
LTRRLRQPQCIVRDERGATIIEFAIVFPVVMMVFMALWDLAYRQYATAILSGEVQRAARAGTLESAQSVSALTAIDERVRRNVKRINANMQNSDFTFTRRNFSDFTGAGKMEATTGPGSVCAAGYTYVDVNNSNTWDDGAQNGVGGAQDVQLYTVTVSYRPLFPINALYGGPANHTVKASTVLRNQPFQDQQARNAGITRNCP